MSERVELAGLDDKEQLRRLAETRVPGRATPEVGAASAVLPPERTGLGAMGSGARAFPRGIGPAGFMAMQRLAGNRAVVQALSRSMLSGPALALGSDLEADEDAVAGTASPAAAAASLAGEAGVALGAPAGGAAGEGTGGAAGGSAGAVEGVLAAAGSVAGGAAVAGEGILGAGRAAAGGAAGSVAGGAAGSVAGGAAVAGEGILGAGLAAAGGAAGAAAGGAAGGGVAAGAGPGSAGPATAGAEAARSASAAAEAGTAAGGSAGGAPATSSTSHPRTSAPPPIVGAGGRTTTGGSGAGAGTRSPGGGPTTGGGPAPASGGPVPAGADLAGGAPAPVPVSAPGPASTAAATGGAPDPNTAKTGIDWNQMLSDFGPPARTVLEVGRLIPGWGLLAGFASDSLSFASDLTSIPNSKNARFATGLIVFRNFVNIENNALGHVLYVNQLIQDGLAGSVVGAEFTPLTAAANEVLSGVKVALDEVQMGTDIVVEVEALYEANHAPDSAEAEKWRQLADSYAANILGDVVNTVLDVISLASAGAANTAPVEEAKLPLTLAGAFLEHAAPNIISTINNILGVWLGSGVTAGRHAASGPPAAGGAGTRPATGAVTGPPTAPTRAGAGAGAIPAVQRLGEGLPGGPDGRAGQAVSLRAQAVAYDTAGGFVDAEAPLARSTFDGINVVIDAFEAYAEDQVAQIDAVVGALTGGKSAFQVIRDAVTAGLDDMNRKVAMVQQLGESATNAQASAKSIAETCDSLLGSIDGLVMPSVHIPEVDLGEGIVASAASAVANTAAEAANAALELAISGVSAALETAKDAVRAPILDIKAHASDIGEWLAILASKCTEMIATLHAHIASFSEGLGHCSNVTEVIDLIIGQVSDLTGMPRFTVQDMRNTWNGIGTYIDQFAALGPQLHEQAAALREQADQLAAGGDNGPTFALPPGPPTNPGEGGGTAEGAAA